MKLLFNLHYLTTFGEELVLNILPGEHVAKAEQYKMYTQDGEHWSCDISKTIKVGAYFDYFYSVNRHGLSSRDEWTVVPHRMELNVVQGKKYVVYDHWNDIPEDSYLYSSAFTDCVAQRKCSLFEMGNYTKTICIKVRAPQLRSTERLAILGDDPVLGSWEIIRAVAMTEHANNEWMVCLNASGLKTNRLEFKFVVVDDAKGGVQFWENSSNRIIDLPSIKNAETLVYELDEAFFPIYPWKGAGTVIPVFSLKSAGSYGVGDFGDLKLMIDWVDKTNQRVLQVLPVNDTNITHTWTDSYPYNSISIYALHPQYTDLRQLPEIKDAKLRQKYEALREELNALPQIDYERVNNAKMDILHILFKQEWASVSKSNNYKDFIEQNKEWLEPYAAFCVNRDKYGTATFSEWPAEVQHYERKTNTVPTEDENFWYYVQFNLDQQMRGAHAYARIKRVVLKGDIPIGISRDGVEAWVEPKYFNLNGQAGAPPDAFSTNGQNWGFPTYNWDAMLEDGCSWWVRRFRKMAEYFDAYRIDHVLGFFRIWEIPINAVHGLLGQFSPSLGMTREEIEAYGLKFQEDLFTTPFIADWTLERIFAERAQLVKDIFLMHKHDDIWQMKPEFDTQRKVEKYFKELKTNRNEPQLAGWDDVALDNLRDGVYALISDVLFVRDRKDDNKFHPRIGVQNDFIFQWLYDSDKFVFNKLYNDYFYRRNNHFWYNEAMKKLPKLTEATRMLVCAEDLGMVPDCVPWVMNELRILSLEIQSMPKDDTRRFGRLKYNPYRSVCTISTHDMPTLRQWWDEDMERTQEYFNTILRRGGAAPHPLPGWLAKDIISRHLTSCSMLCLLSLQDWLSMDEKLRLTDENAERINVPAIPRYYWRYRMHISIEELMKANSFNDNISELIVQSARK